MAEFDANRTNPVKNQYLGLLELDAGEYEAAAADFVRARVAQLEVESPHEGYVSFGTGNLQDYITADTVIDSTVLGSGYRLDDATAYEHIGPLMRTFYTSILERVGGDSDKAYRNAAFYTAQYVQQQYFGSVSGDLRARRGLAMDILDDDVPVGPKSVSQVGSAAVCMERVAIANNVLHILGLKPVLEIGKISVVGEPEDPDISHVYLFVAGRDGAEYLYDPTNPRLVFDEAGNLLETSPSLYPVGDALNARDPSQPIVGEHVTSRVVEGRPQVDKKILHFSLSETGRELHPA